MTRTRLLLGCLLVSCAIAACGGLAVYAWYRYEYPYGKSPGYDKALWSALRQYADAHGGAFPSGESSPEASLSLIPSKQDDCARLLCGRSGSPQAAQRLLDNGRLLGPTTCGWNYVEGLRAGDDPRLALFWDKEGLGPDGQRLWAGGHIVTLVNGASKHVNAADWEEFLEEQETLRAYLKRTLEPTTPAPPSPLAPERPLKSRGAGCQPARRSLADTGRLATCPTADK